jgi:phage terminase small subunit
MANRLTSSEEVFAVAVAGGMNYFDAYCKAYPDASHVKTTAQPKACNIAKKPHVVARLAELRAPAIRAAQVSIEDHLNDLKDLRDEARAAGQMAAAISAEVSRGKVCGHYVDRSEVTGKDGKDLVAAITINLVKPDAR